MSPTACRPGFGLLGPLTVVVDGEERIPRAAKVRTLLALLVAHAGSTVTAVDICDELWPQGAPDSAASAVYVYISQLRKLLGPRPGSPRRKSMIESARPGYRLGVPPECTDLNRFRSLAETARRGLDRGDPGEAARSLREALSVWRGPALQGVESSGALMRLAVGLNEQRMTLQEQLFDLELQQGRHAAVLSDMVELSRAHPLREGLAAQLMLALYRCGQQAEALSTYRRMHATLRDDLGVDPGEELREVHRQILNGTTRSSSAPLRLVVGPRRPAPAQLTSTTADFVGRGEALTAVRSTLVEPGRLATACCEISGPGGVGKSALALRAAHRTRSEFPDGQLFAQLRANDGTPVAPEDILESFLAALGVDRHSVPGPLQDRARLFRTQLTDRRVLVVLDDVVDEIQLRPLLPGATGCAVLITTRAPLLGLHGFRRVRLPMFSLEESVSLLRRILGNERVDAELWAARRVAEMCGRLPLAVHVAGVRLSVRPDLRIGQFAEFLADEDGRLDHLVGGDADVRASLTATYGARSALERRALRLLAHAAPTDFPYWVLGVVLGTDMSRSMRLLDDLVSAQLVQPLDPRAGRDGRYALHPLIRILAREMPAEEPGERHHARRRQGLALSLANGSENVS